MASDDGSASEHAPSPEFQVKSVMAVKVRGQKRVWLPETKRVEDTTFFSIGKWNRAATYALTGKGLDLRSHKAAHTMNGSFYDKMLKLRQEACVAELTKMFRQAAESIGETFDPKTMRDPTDNDKYIAGQIVEITLPEYQVGETKVGPLKACSVETLTLHRWYLIAASPWPRFIWCLPTLALNFCFSINLVESALNLWRSPVFHYWKCIVAYNFHEFEDMILDFLYLHYEISYFDQIATNTLWNYHVLIKFQQITLWNYHVLHLWFKFPQIHYEISYFDEIPTNTLQQR